MARQTTAPSAFGTLHKQYVTSLYRRFLRDSLDWNIRRDLWRADAQHIRAEFEHNRNVRNPRELASILNRAEEKLASRKHPDPYKRTYERKSETDRSADVRGRNQVVRIALMTQLTTGSATCLYVLLFTDFSAAYVHRRGKVRVAQGPARVAGRTNFIYQNGVRDAQTTRVRKIAGP